MKQRFIPTGILRTLFAVVLVTASTHSAPAARSAETANVEAVTRSEEKLKALFTEAYLSGRWAPLKEGVLGEERSGDKYQIVSITKVDGDKWTISAKLKYRDQEFVIPIPVTIQFAGDAMVLMVNDFSIPGGGTYSARLLIHEKTYSGSWKSARGGGMLYGTISNAAN